MIFFGTSKFSTDILDRLKELGVLPTHIVTVPDRPQGRKMLMTPPPAKVWAEVHKIPCMQFEKLKEYEKQNGGQSEKRNPVAELTRILTDQPESERIFIVASYGKIIPQSILEIPKYGAFNVHPSLLPKYRGASPLQSTLLANEQNLGVCIIKMDVEMDHGPIVAVEKLTPGEDKLRGWPFKFTQYEQVTAQIGAELLHNLLPKIVNGTVEFGEQDHSQTTYTKKISKEDGHMQELTNFPAKDLQDQQNIAILRGEKGLNTYLKFCALEGWPGLHFFIKRKGTDIRIKITDMQWHTVGNPAENYAEITKVIPEGKKETDWKNFVHTLA